MGCPESTSWWFNRWLHDHCWLDLYSLSRIFKWNGYGRSGEDMRTLSPCFYLQRSTCCFKPAICTSLLLQALSFLTIISFKVLRSSINRRNSTSELRLLGCSVSVICLHNGHEIHTRVAFCIFYKKNVIDILKL